jgi:hypothetical protein
MKERIFSRRILEQISQRLQLWGRTTSSHWQTMSMYRRNIHFVSGIPPRWDMPPSRYIAKGPPWLPSQAFPRFVVSMRMCGYMVGRLPLISFFRAKPTHIVQVLCVRLRQLTTRRFNFTHRDLQIPQRIPYPVLTTRQLLGRVQWWCRNRMRRRRQQIQSGTHPSPHQSAVSTTSDAGENLVLNFLSGQARVPREICGDAAVKAGMSPMVLQSFSKSLGSRLEPLAQTHSGLFPHLTLRKVQAPRNACGRQPRSAGDTLHDGHGGSRDTVRCAGSPINPISHAVH